MLALGRRGHEPGEETRAKSVGRPTELGQRRRREPQLEFKGEPLAVGDLGPGGDVADAAAEVSLRLAPAELDLRLPGRIGFDGHGRLRVRDQRLAAIDPPGRTRLPRGLGSRPGETPGAPLVADVSRAAARDLGRDPRHSSARRGRQRLMHPENL